MVTLTTLDFADTSTEVLAADAVPPLPEGVTPYQSRLPGDLIYDRSNERWRVRDNKIITYILYHDPISPLMQKVWKARL